MWPLLVNDFTKELISVLWHYTLDRKYEKQLISCKEIFITHTPFDFASEKLSIHSPIAYFSWSDTHSIYGNGLEMKASRKLADKLKQIKYSIKPIISKMWVLYLEFSMKKHQRNINFPSINHSQWKISNSRVNFQILKNYRPVSLLPVCTEIFERIIYNRIKNL